MTPHTQNPHNFSKILSLPIKDFWAPSKSFPYILIWIAHTEMEEGFLLTLYYYSYISIQTSSDTGPQLFFPR